MAASGICMVLAMNSSGRLMWIHRLAVTFVFGC